MDSHPGPGDDLSLDGPRLRAVPASGAHAAAIQSCFEGAPDYFVRTEGSLPGPDAAIHLLADAEVDPQRRVYALVPGLAFDPECRRLGPGAGPSC